MLTLRSNFQLAKSNEAQTRIPAPFYSLSDNQLLLDITFPKLGVDLLAHISSIYPSWSRLHPDEETPAKIKFKGFDGNNEPDLRSYVQYFIMELDRFDELKYGQSFPSFNSHTRMLERYRNQLNIWRNFDFDLNEEQITAILEA